MQQIILFIMTYITVFLVYQFIILRKAKKRNSKKKPVEVNYLIYKYKIDLKKVNYKQLLMTISLVSSLDISILITVVLLSKSYILSLILILILIIPLIIFSYSFIGKYYIKKGMIKDE